MLGGVSGQLKMNGLRKMKESWMALTLYVTSLGAPCSDNIMMWNAVIFGPGMLWAPNKKRSSFTFCCLLADTPFEDGTFKLVLQFDETYVRKHMQIDMSDVLTSFFLLYVAQQTPFCQVCIENVPS